MKLRATFPVSRNPRSRKLQDNLVNAGAPEECLVSKDPNKMDLLAIRPQNCLQNEEKSFTVCEGTIDYHKCTACLACQIGVADSENSVDESGMPVEKGCYKYDVLANSFFKGAYVCYPSKNNVALPIIKRFNDYTGVLGESNFTNPLIACYLWAVSGGDAVVSCSPSHELSLDVSILTGEREGHLDVTLRTSWQKKKYLFVAEGKKDVAALLNDSNREQQKKYEHRIIEVAHELQYIPLFSYVVGGGEEAMYPPGIPLPNYLYRKKFFHDVLKQKKRFVSVHALRGLGVLHIASRGKLCLENTLFPLFENEEVFGLVLGGPIVYRNKMFVLDSLDNFLSIC